MKNIIKFICTVFVLLPFAGCNPYNTWGEGLPELENTYYVGFVKTGIGSERDLQYRIAANGKAEFMYREQYNNSGSGGAIGETQTWITTEGLNVTGNIPIRFVSERVRSYDVVTYFWIEEVNNALSEADYEVIPGDGTVQLARESNKVYTLTWPQAKKAVQNIKIKRKTAATGRIRVVTLNKDRFEGAAIPNRAKLEQLLNNQTNEYTVRGFYFDYSNITTTPSATSNGPVNVTFQ